jgi:hypothetical protein
MSDFDAAHVVTACEKAARDVCLVVFGELVRGSVDVGARHLIEIWRDMMRHDREDRHRSIEEFSASIGVELARAMGMHGAPDDDCVLDLSDIILGWWETVSRAPVRPRSP